MAHRVLVVEDDPADFLLVQDALSGPWQDRYELEHATTLADGLQRIGESAPDLVVLDMGLPDSQAMETVHAVAKTGVGFVVLTGTDDSTLGRDAVKAGAQDYLAKSHVFPELVERTVRYALLRGRSGRMPPTPEVSGELQILFIEDDEGDRETYSAELAMMSDIQVGLQTAGTLEAGRVMAPQADLILLDLCLPDAADLEALEALQLDVPSTPIIVVTGSDDYQQAQDAILAGAQDYLVKGRFVPEQLRRAVRFVMERRAWLQEA